MKKTFKILLSAFLLTLTVILSFSLIASAEIVTGYAEDIRYNEAWWYVWKFDTETSEMFINKGEVDTEREDWDGWAEMCKFDRYCSQAKHIYLGSGEIVASFSKYNCPELETVSAYWYECNYKENGEPKIDSRLYLTLDVKSGVVTVEDLLYSKRTPKHNPDTDDFEDTMPIFIAELFEKDVHTIVFDDTVRIFLKSSLMPYPFWNFGFSFKNVVLGKRVEKYCDFELIASESYAVDPENPHFSAYEDCLYSKDYEVLVAVPYDNFPRRFHQKTKIGLNGSVLGENGDDSWYLDPATLTMYLDGSGEWNATEEYDFVSHYTGISRIVIGDDITSVDSPLPTAETVVFGKSFSQTYAFPIPTKNYVLSPENKHFALFDGGLYSKDYKKLYYYPGKYLSVRFHPDTEEITYRSSSVSYISSYIGPVILPDKVKKVDRHAFNYLDEYIPIVLPDSITELEGFLPGTGPGSEGSQKYKQQFFYSDKNKVAKENTRTDGKIDTARMADKYSSAKTIDDIYRLSKNGQDIRTIRVEERETDKGRYYICYENNKILTGKQEINGKLFFMNKDGSMYFNSWIKDGDKWYYAGRNYAALVKYWVEDNGKWYYLQADGTMATNKWIKWYNKWYYVGKDGAMYANRKTPDGYWVNASGVWVK